MSNVKALGTRKSMKKLKEEKRHIASGSINLLHNLQQFSAYSSKIFHLKMKSNKEEVAEICIQYEIDFDAPPEVDTTLSIEIGQLFNLSNNSEETLETAFHFPVGNGKFKPAFMHQQPMVVDSNGFLSDLQCLQMDLTSAQAIEFGFKYENFQTSSGLESVYEIIQRNEKLMIELRWNQKVFMSLISLNVFNYEGVTESKFLVPLYQRNGKMIDSLFHQEMCAFPEKAVKADKKKVKSMIAEQEIESTELIPLTVGDKPVAMMVKVKLTNPLKPETLLKDLKLELNQHVSIIEEIRVEENETSKAEFEFERIIRKIAKKIENFIEKNPQVEAFELQHKIKAFIESGELYGKAEFKDVVKTLIGNKFNATKKTETNHDFKVRSLKGCLESTIFSKEQ